MKALCLVAAAFVAGLFCFLDPESRRESEREMGPPPPGDIRITGEPVPGWEPSALLERTRSAGPLAWQSVGPRPIRDEYWSGDDDASGRVVSIAPHPTNPAVVYIASASGGIWKTVDAGMHWTPLTDELSTLNHGAVALDPQNPNVIYAGTGEYTTQSRGDGLFRSTDAGATWQRIAETWQVGIRCSEIVVDPSNSEVLHLTSELGYCRSADGGATWETRLNFSGASDCVVDPVDPMRVYVAMHSDGIYRSVDRGLSFVKLTNNLPSFDVRRIILAIAPSSPNTLYAAFVSPSNGLRGLYKTVDGGDTWTLLSNTPNFPSPQGWYDLFVGVDPKNADVVYAGGVFPSYAPAGVIKSTNGGTSWTDITISPIAGQLHPDQHAIGFGPDGTLWIGNDGGVWKSTDGGASWINTNATLNVTQNYQIALHPSDPLQLIGGTQDNGTITRYDESLDWPQILSGDGGFAAYDPTDPERRYVTYVRLSVYRIDSSGYTSINGAWSGDSKNFIAPLVMDPNDSRTLVAGTTRVWRTKDADTAATWTPISTTSVAAGGILNTLSVAVGASDTIYTGSNNGRVFVTVDGVNWQNRSTGLPTSGVSDIVIDPGDAATAYVSYYGTSGARVLQTSNYGVAWQDVTGDLPSGVAARALAVDWRFEPPGLYIGAGSGVWWSFNGGANWTKDGADFPNVNVGDLQIDRTGTILFVGTYGRGAWFTALPRRGDIDLDGDVDEVDRDLFVFVLLGQPQSASHPSRADMNGDGVNDGDDVPAFVAALLGP